MCTNFVWMDTERYTEKKKAGKKQIETKFQVNASSIATNCNIDSYRENHSKQSFETNQPIGHKNEAEDSCFVQDSSPSGHTNSTANKTFLFDIEKASATAKKDMNTDAFKEQYLKFGSFSSTGRKSENKFEVLNGVRDPTMPGNVLGLEKNRPHNELNISSQKTLKVENTYNERAVGDSTAVSKPTTKIIEEKFQEFKQGNKAKFVSVRKELKVAVANAEMAAHEARVKAKKMRAMERLENTTRKRKLVRVRPTIRSGRMNSTFSSITDLSKSLSKTNVEKNTNLEEAIQTHLGRVNEKQLARRNIALNRVDRLISRRRLFERHEIDWLALELRNLNLSEHAHKLSVAFRKKEEMELQLRLELRREKKRMNDSMRRVKQAEREQEKREARKKKQLEKQKLKIERLEKLRIEEEERKKREHDKILLKNFQDSIFSTSFSRSKTFSYFALLDNKSKKKSRLSDTARYAQITSRYKQMISN